MIFIIVHNINLIYLNQQEYFLFLELLTLFVLAESSISYNLCLLNYQVDEFGFKSGFIFSKKNILWKKFLCPWMLCFHWLNYFLWWLLAMIFQVLVEEEEQFFCFTLFLFRRTMWKKWRGDSPVSAGCGVQHKTISKN